MADLKAAIYTFLTGLTNVTDKVGLRIFPMLAPGTATTPYMTYQQIGHQQEINLATLSGLTRTPFQFDVYGATADEAEDAALAIRPEIDGYRGLMGTVEVNRVIVTSVVDNLEEPSEGRTLGVWRHIISADIWFQP